VLDIVHNGMDIAILDTSAACHMPDVLEMPYRPPVLGGGRPGERATGGPAQRALGARARAGVDGAAAADYGLPAEFPARLGLGVLADYAVTLDFKNRRVLFENPVAAADDVSATRADEDVSEPIHYRGVRP
jgi:hypothetical protein